ncbi:MAG: hypothetical protein JWL83_4504 [Actinomycetia bacterium]|jgi:hypothetical protein|nr:hypothetical protein [Actinomycetes bacterium]
MADDPNTKRATTTRRVIVRYKTKPERAAENQQLVEAVFAALERSQPEGLRYATFRLDDGVSFVHVASVETDDGSNPLEAVEEFRRFGKEVAERCEEPPVVQVATLVGSYRLFDR